MRYGLAGMASLAALLGVTGPARADGGYAMPQVPGKWLPTPQAPAKAPPEIVNGRPHAAPQAPAKALPEIVNGRPHAAPQAPAKALPEIVDGRPHAAPQAPSKASHQG